MRIHNPIISILLLASVLWASSCKDKVPSQYPNKKEMVEMLADIHIAEAALTINRHGATLNEAHSNGVYKSVLDKYGLTKAQFDSALVWYTMHPKIYIKVYDELIAKLSTIEAQVLSDLSKLEEKEKELAELMTVKNLWKDTTAYPCPYADSLDNRFPFDVTVDSLRLGQIRVSALYRFKKEDMTKKAELWVISCYADSTQDTLKTKIRKSFLGLTSTALADIKPEKILTGVKGYLLWHDTIQKPIVDIENIQLEHIPSLDTNDYAK